MQLKGGAKTATVGSRAQVMHGTAKKTSGGLTKDDLMMKNGRIVSRKASRAAKRSSNLSKAGYTAKKGEFGAYRKTKSGKLVKVKGATRHSK